MVYRQLVLNRLLIIQKPKVELALMKLIYDNMLFDWLIWCIMSHQQLWSYEDGTSVYSLTDRLTKPGIETTNGE